MMMMMLLLLMYTDIRNVHVFKEAHNLTCEFVYQFFGLILSPRERLGVFADTTMLFLPTYQAFSPPFCV